MDIHNYKRQFERQIELVKEDSKISEDNKKIILNFKDYLLSEGIGLAKIGRYLLDLRKYGKMLKKSLDEADKSDLRQIVAEIEQTDLSPETKKCFKVMLRKLYRFIRGVEEKGVYPDEVRWISIHIPQNHKKLPEELLNEEELLKIIQNCQTVRDKAIISTLAESGCRVSEVGNMQIKHVSFEEYGARLTVGGKTGMRKILVINSSPYLQEWINQHPGNEDQESFLWVGRDTKAICYARIMSILKTAGKRAGIKKRIYLHLLRHSRATLLASKMSDSALKHYLGWTQSSKMAGIYIHMSGKETDETILEMNGIKAEKKETKSLMRPKKCLKCKTINEVTNRFCKICGLPLDQKEADKILEGDLKRNQADDLMNRLIDDQEFKEMLMKKLKNLS